MKCKLCNLESEVEDEFMTSKRCMTCHKMRQRAYRRSYYKKNKEKLYKYTLDWRKKNKEQWEAYKRRWEQENPERLKMYRIRAKEAI